MPNPARSTNFAPGLVVDVRSDVNTDRPGMPTVATLPDERMVLAYEICGEGRNCEAQIGPVVDPAQNCSTSYSPHLLLDASGRTVRFTTATATATGPTGRMEATAVANSGVLPYADAFAKGRSGWVDYGGCWTTSGGVLSETCGGTGGNKSIAGSTGWTDYRLAGDVRIDGGAAAGFVVRASDPGEGPMPSTVGVRGHAGTASGRRLTITRAG
ncbi:hypothetical protein [Streptomyces sp. NEAU-YJ-81]|uniref:hypothetical protein n=1 Tax=Streptomyces sp. NEAU-YJ-81 TaxID=2820288 RepID=UPI001ABC791C|nr:hypothetical protein [Streptomyces sp. NEAU-YJ-81]MBO3678740.1 hypothetical protein [Streptomyces sp. NEAU-YJ-81]